MYNLIGIDEDGIRHRFRTCKTEQEAKDFLDKAMSIQERVKAPYRNVVEQAKKDEEQGKNTGLYYSDYLGWKMLGFYVKRFELEWEEDY